VTWRVVLAGNCGTGLTMDAANSQNMQAALTSPGNGRSGIYESRDGGATWTPRTAVPEPRCPRPASPQCTWRAPPHDLRQLSSGANWSIFRTNSQT